MNVRGFEPHPLRHVAVVQLVEHQIVALVVVDSSSTGHPTPVRRIQKRTKPVQFLSTFWRAKRGYSDGGYNSWRPYGGVSIIGTATV